MINFKTFRFGCVALSIFLAAFPGSNCFAGKEELAASTAETEVIENGDNVGVGKFFKLPFHVSISVRGGYDDNILTAPFDRQGSAFVNATLGVNYSFGNPRTQLSLASTIGFTAYAEGPADVNNDFNPNLTLALTHRATPRLTLALNSYTTYQQQPDFTNNFIGVNRRSGSYFFTADKISASYMWKPRFSTVTSYNLVAISYDDSATGSFEDRSEHTFGNEFRFLVLPTTSLVAEYRFGIVAYDFSSPQSRDSTTHYFLGGINHSFSPRFNISARAGVELRSYDNFGERTDPYAEATLVYALGPHLSLSWTNRYSLEEPSVPGAPSRTTFRTGLNARYNLTARIVASINAFWQHDSNDGQVMFFFVSPAFEEDVFSLGGSLRYALNRNWGAELGYDFVDVESGIAIREYYRNRFYGGINFQF